MLVAISDRQWRALVAALGGVLTAVAFVGLWVAVSVPVVGVLERFV